MNVTNSTKTHLTKEEVCSLPTETKYQIQTAFLIFVLILTFVGNLLVVLAVVFFHRLRSITNYFIVSLAVSDLLIAVLSLPFRIDQTIHNTYWCLGVGACLTWMITDTMVSYASMWNLAIISIDRYMAIVHPFRYHSIITTTVGYGLIGFVWCFSLTFSLLMLTNWTHPGQQHLRFNLECTNGDRNYFTVTSSLALYAPLLIVLVMYGGVFRVAFNQAKAMAALQIASTNRGRRSSINLVREVKAAKTLAIVIGCFVVCWFPFSVLLQISLWNPKLITDVLSEDAIKALVLIFVYALPAVNSTLNPIIYALFNRDFRQAFIKLAKRITGQPLGAVGYGDASTAGTNVSTAGNGTNHKRAIRFKDHDSESSEALPTIPMRDPNAFYNSGCEGSPTTGNTAPHDTNSLETTLDDERPRQCATPNGDAKVDTEPPQSNGVVVGNVDSEENPSIRELPQKLPPLEKNGTQSTDDDVDLGGGKFPKPLTLPPIESTTNGELNPSPSPARSEHSDRSSSSFVNVRGSEQKDEDKDKDSDRTETVL